MLVLLLQPPDLVVVVRLLLADGKGSQKRYHRTPRPLTLALEQSRAPAAASKARRQPSKCSTTTLSGSLLLV